MGVRISWLTLARNSSLGPAGRLGRLLGPPQLLLGPLALGDVADEGGEQVLPLQADEGDGQFRGELPPSRRRAGTSMTRFKSGPSPVARKWARPRRAPRGIAAG